MAMRLDLYFPRPLTREERTRCLIVVAGLSKSRRLRWVDGGYGAVISGTAMRKDRVRELLDEAEIPLERITSSLSDDEDAVADEVAKDGRERFRPMGR